MFIVLLRFSTNKDKSPQLMDGHNAWIKAGFGDGVFLLAGGLKPGAGGCVIAYNTSRTDLERRVNEDPFVAEGVVSAEILEIAPGKTDERLTFLTAA